jgi:Domain of unknown function (DUF1905)
MAFWSVLSAMPARARGTSRSCRRRSRRRPTRPWDPTPVTATVDDATWETRLWRDAKSSRSLLAVPERHRGTKSDGDRVTVTLVFDPDDA